MKLFGKVGKGLTVKSIRYLMILWNKKLKFQNLRATHCWLFAITLNYLHLNLKNWENQLVTNSLDWLRKNQNHYKGSSIVFQRNPKKALSACSGSVRWWRSLLRVRTYRTASTHRWIFFSKRTAPGW